MEGESGMLATTTEFRVDLGSKYHQMGENLLAVATLKI